MYQSVGPPSMVSANCEWCTIVLKKVSYKSIAVQDEAKKKMALMEDDWSRNSELKALHKDIAESEAKLDRLRQKAWLMANDRLLLCKGEK
jgi:hypothetical protein